MNKNFDEKKNIIADEELEKVSAGMEGSVFIPTPYVHFENNKIKSIEFAGGIAGGIIDNA